MVTPKPKFLIDTIFIFENTHKAFLGAPLFTKDTQDNTFLYGFLRYFLWLRQSIGINAGIMGIGKETYSVTSALNIANVIRFLQNMDIPFIHDPQKSILSISFALLSQISAIVSKEKKLLQLVKDNLMIVFPNDLKNIDYLIPKVIVSKMAVRPECIPTFLTLTQGSKSSALTKHQAIRLIELYGDLDHIYENISNISAQAQKDLFINRDKFLNNYHEIKINDSDRMLQYKCNDIVLNMDTERNRELLKSYAFYSLIRLLSPPSDIVPYFTAEKQEANSYQAVVDQKGLEALETMLQTSEFCAIDTESDDKDPQLATIFGVSFSVKKGQAFFVPFIENDLKGITRQEVHKTIKRIFKMPIKFIGHNIKYDYLLLRRNGIIIKFIYFDTMLAAYECYGDWTFFNLGFLSEKLLGRKIKSYKDIVGKELTFIDLPFKDIVHHACEDADMTFCLYHILKKQLEDKRVAEQYWLETLPLIRILGEMEHNGISINIPRLNKIRQNLLKTITEVKQYVNDKVGKLVDLDSQKELAIFLKDDLELNEYPMPKSITLSRLEQLAVNHPVVKLIVKYKRFQKQLRGIESIQRVVKNNKIYPLFNQIKSPNGLLSTTNPNIYDIDGISDLQNCFNKNIPGHFKDPKSSLDILANLTQDSNLSQDRKQLSNTFMKNHALMGDIDHDLFFLSIVIGFSNASLSRLFMIDHLTISLMRHDLEMRYLTLFQWLENYKKQATLKGYAIHNNNKKYFDGLKSSNLEKRKIAQNFAVRWLIQY